MAKDPAVLWYYRDYLEGTELMSWAEQGAYARLLNKQADKGSLSIDLIKKILKKDFDKIWPAISGKFLIDDEGNFYNERMSVEVDKRKKNSKHQKDKAEERWRKERQSRGNAAAYASAMPLENANANVTAIGKEGGAGETWNTMPGDAQFGLDLPEIKAGSAIELMRITSKQVVTHKQINELWEVFKRQYFTGTKFYADPSEAHSHFMNWVKMQKINGTGTEQAGGKTGKLGTSEARVKTAREW